MLDPEAMRRNAEQIERMRQKLKKLSESVEDMRPVFQEFVPEYVKIIKQNFEAKGKIMERQRWKEYTPAYLKLKRVKYSGKPMLEVTGKLKSAALSPKVKIKKDNLIMQVKGEDYYYWVSDRVKYGRKYFYTKDKDIPIQAWRKLIEIGENHLKEAVK